MKNLFLIILSLLIYQLSFAQNGEFQQHSNGLIYSQGTMDKLTHIVDSLNLQHKVCDLNKKSYSVSQTIGHIVELKKGNFENALKDIKEKIPLREFITKYPSANIKNKVLVIRNSSTNFQGDEKIEFSEVNLQGRRGFEIQADIDKPTSKWLYRYYKKSNRSKGSLKAFYFPDEFKSIQIDEKYARQIGYADCLIDTTSTKFKKDLEEGWIGLPGNWKELSKENQASLLDTMRETRVIGYCSQDSRPRIHAVNIAQLATETTNWEVFLKAHLDIMNDRFERMSDGNYAWGRRKTYLKELEELNINTLNLLIGISLRTENNATNHYYGSISRVGRAFSDAKNKEEIENEILSMIKDPELDNYNSCLLYSSPSPRDRG